MIKRENEILKSVVKIIKKNVHPRKIILFGSRAKGKNQKGSDFDIAVDSLSLKARQKRQLLEEIEEISGLYEVDLVYLSSVSPAFKKLILEQGKVVYEQRN